ncbi:MAG: radical SAM protein, partial [Bdellovibrionota bacterium]
MRIFLINPPSNCSDTLPWLEPLGLSYIGAVCRDAGHDVRIRDLLTIEKADIPALFAELDGFRPDLVGFTAMSEHFRNGLELARAVKSRYGCTVVFGGWHVSGEPRAALESAIDFVVRGEGEDTILELLDYLQGKGPALDQIDGIAYEKDGILRITRARDRIKKLARLPAPMREGLPVGSYRFPMLYSVPVSRMNTLSVQASRGCPYKCVFCQTPALWSNLWSKRAPVAVVDEIEELVNRYNINTLIFRDEEFTIRPQWVMEICEEMARRGLPKKITWGSFARVDD